MDAMVMQEKAGIGIDSWDVVSRKACIIGMSQSEWYDAVFNLNVSIINKSISRLSRHEFAHFFGMSNFIEKWPLIRDCLDRPVVSRLYDILWSLNVSGTWDCPPIKDFWKLSHKDRSVLMCVIKDNDNNLADISKICMISKAEALDSISKLVASNAIYENKGSFSDTYSPVASRHI